VTEVLATRFQDIISNKGTNSGLIDTIISLPETLTRVLLGSRSNAEDISIYKLDQTYTENLNYIMSILNNMYTLRRGGRVGEFLRDNTYLTPIISEAYPELQKHFPYSTFFMDVDQGILVISVGTTLSPEEANENLNRFDEEWWLNVCVKSHAKLCITVEFQ
jgi:hypothetical protein